MGIYKGKLKSKEKREKTRPRPRNDKEKKFLDINQFYFQTLKIVSVICRFDQIKYIKYIY